MTLKEIIQQGKKEQEQNTTRRVYADISMTADLGLEKLATAANKTKKGMLEYLITNAVAEFDAMEKETNKRAKKAGK